MQAAVALSFAFRVASLGPIWNSFEFWPGAGAESQLYWMYNILFAMATYGVAFQLLALVQCSARAHCLVHNCHLTSPVTVGVLPDSDSKSALLTQTMPKGGLYA